MGKIASIIGTAAVGVGVLFGYVSLVTSQPTQANRVGVSGVYCPEEDSCVADYDGELNTWVIYEVRP